MTTDTATGTSASDPYGEDGERYCSISPRTIWGAIAAAWDELPSWELDLGAARNWAKAEQVALDAIAKAIEENPG
jgi:hypothetical protein